MTAENEFMEAIAYAGLNNPNNGNGEPDTKLFKWALRFCYMGIGAFLSAILFDNDTPIFVGSGLIAISGIMILIDYILARKKED